MDLDQILAEFEVLDMQFENRDNSRLISNPMEELLLIDEDHSFRASAKRFLCSQGYKVWQADNSSEALSLLKLRNALKVIVLDLGCESGLALAAHLRRKDPGRYLIVALTSNPSIPAAEEALNSGIFYYLTKPAAGHSSGLAFAISFAFEESQKCDYSSKRKAEEDKDLIFLSCASEDLDKVSVLHQRLANERFSPWLYSRDLYPGQQWRLKVAETIKASSFFLFCLSNAALAKTGFVHNEIKQALDVQSRLPESRIFLIPVRLEDCPLPEALEHLVYADLFAADGYRRLLDALRIERRACALNSGYR